MSLRPELPREVARLLNPAFSGALLQRAVEGYAEAEPGGMPLPLLYLVLPIILHEPTRRSLPAKRTTKFATWIARHPEVRAGFAVRAQSLLTYSTTGLGLLLDLRVLELRAGLVRRTAVGVRRSTVYPKTSAEVGDCWSRALLLGRLLPSVTRVSRVFVSLGVRP